MNEQEKIEKTETCGNAPEKDEKKCCRHSHDLRTFVISALTTLILLALYHFGMGLCAIIGGGPGCCVKPAPCQYVLVPVAALPCDARPAECPMNRRGDFRRPGMMQGHGDFRRGEMPRRGQRGEVRHDMHKGHAPMTPAPAPAPAPAPVPSAPAPVPAPAK